MKTRKLRYLVLGTMGICLSSAFTPAIAASIAITNAGFESQTLAPQDLTDNVITGWSVYDPGSVLGSTGYVFGALNPTGTGAGVVGTDTGYISNTAFQGSNVAYTFGPGESGATGAFGIQQILAAVLAANTVYNLQVAVGNPAPYSEFDADAGGSLNLFGFPGYRIELLAGSTVIAFDNNSQSIGDGLFGNSSSTYTALATDSLLGQALRIRLINLNGAALDIPGHEVDFDNVRLDATPTNGGGNGGTVPEPGSLALLGIAAAGLGLSRRRRSAVGVA